jgi:hypothetical protein
MIEKTPKHQALAPTSSASSKNLATASAIEGSTNALVQAIHKREIFGWSDGEAFCRLMAEIRSVPCSPELAQKAALALIAAYPERRMANERGYTGQLLEVLMAYPAALVLRAMDPVHGLVSERGMFPSIGDVSIWFKRTWGELEEKERKALGELRHRPKQFIPEVDPRIGTTPESRAEVVRKALGRIPQPKTDRVAPPKTRMTVSDVIDPEPPANTKEFFDWQQRREKDIVAPPGDRG